MSAPPLLRPLAVNLVTEEIGQRREEKGPKAALAADGAPDVALFQNPDKKLLGKILRLLDRISATTNVGIQRIPILLAQRGKCLVAQRVCLPASR